MKSNKLIAIFLTLLCGVNLVQGYYTELLADEAYYWVYSNFLDWGYFDHPPMVAVWITISKFFFVEGELSVRFFSAITLSLTFYLVWLLIDTPKKHQNAWLFVIITLSTSLFNVYGFITVPDTPLLFFMALFLFGYQKYIAEHSFWSYLILATSMAGMLYSKYQALLIIVFVLFSNIKVLKDYKIWITALATILLFTPHLYWQYANDFPSFKYHLFERKENTVYRFRDTYMHLINVIAIIGFTFPIVYNALIKNLKTYTPFQKALNFLAVGFIVFFFISTFKGHAQAQWIVAISIPLIIITFNYLIKHEEKIKVFKLLASITIFITTFLRIAMINDGLLPHQFEMHGNKKWVSNLDKKLNNQTPLFINSYQNPSIYWFYTGKRPYQYNSWYSRKNHYDLLPYNTHTSKENLIEVSRYKQPFSSDSIIKKNTKKLFLTPILNYQKEGVSFKFDTLPTLRVKALNKVNITIENPNNIDLQTLTLNAILKDVNHVTMKDKTTLRQSTKMFKAQLLGTQLEILIPFINDTFSPQYLQIVGTANTRTQPVKIGYTKLNFINE